MQKILYKTDQNNPAIKEYKAAIRKGEKDHHVLPKDKGWIVKRLLSDKVSASFPTQEEAIKHAESIARIHGTAVFIHGADGRIKERRDY
jgi:hypothetical protein